MPELITAASAGTVTIGDITVNRFGLGTNRITVTENAANVLRRAVGLGVQFIDTADIYTQSESEKMIAKTLAPYPAGVLIATKGGMSPIDHKATGHPEYLRGALDRSLQRLKLTQVDLYQLHRVDPNVPFVDTLGFLKAARDAGKIRHVGLSDVTVEQIEIARKILPIASVQNQYNLFDRKHDAVVDHCEANNIVFIPWFPLGRGKIGNENAALEKLAAKYDATPFQIALKWLLLRSPIMLPIPGTLSVEHLESNLAAATLPITLAEMNDHLL